MIVELIVE